MDCALRGSQKCLKTVAGVVPVNHQHHTMFPGGQSLSPQDTIKIKIRVLLLSWSKSVLTMDLHTTGLFMGEITNPLSVTERRPKKLSSKAKTSSLMPTTICSRRLLIGRTPVPWPSLENLWFSPQPHNLVRIPRAQLCLRSQVPRLRAGNIPSRNLQLYLSRLRDRLLRKNKFFAFQ